MRQQIEALENHVARYGEAYLRESELLRHISDEKAQLKEALAEVRELAGRFSILTDPDRISDVRDSQYQVLTGGANSYWAHVEQSDHLCITTLHAVEAVVQTDQFKSAIHAKLEYCNGRVSYALSEAAVLAMTEEQLIAKLTRHVAPLLIKELVRKMKHHGG